MHKFLPICVFACLTVGIVGAAAKQEPPSPVQRRAPDTSGTAENAADFTPVLGKEWKLASVAKGDADIGFSRDALGEDMSGFYTLSFTTEAQETDGAVKQVYRISGMAAPNRYFADYQQNGSAVSFGLIGSTKMLAFKEPETLKEQAYFAYLQGVNRWALTGDGLELYGADADGTAVVLRFTTE